MRKPRPVTANRLDVVISEKLLARFWAKVDKRGPDECWPWKAYSMPGSYGQFGCGSRVFLAHRISWIIANGSIPQHAGYHGFCVCHKCDNPKCVNPNHLFLGTNADNVHDMDKKGRRKVDPVFGEAHGKSKLTEKAVEEIRKARNAGMKMQPLADKFGISIVTVSAVCRRRTWRHVA